MVDLVTTGQHDNVYLAPLYRLQHKLETGARDGFPLGFHIIGNTGDSVSPLFRSICQPLYLQTQGILIGSIGSIVNPCFFLYFWFYIHRDFSFTA